MQKPMTASEAFDFAIDHCQRDDRMTPLCFEDFVAFALGGHGADTIASVGFGLVVRAMLPESFLTSAATLKAMAIGSLDIDDVKCPTPFRHLLGEDERHFFLELEEQYLDACYEAAKAFRLKGFVVALDAIPDPQLQTELSNLPH